MPWAPRRSVTIPSSRSQTEGWEMNDYSKGMNSYITNDKFPVMTGMTKRLMGSNMWRLAQDARILSLGQYETRKGFDYYSAAAGEAQDQAITSSTGAADVSFTTTTRLAQVFTAGSTGQLTRLDINIRNPSSIGTGVVLACLYSSTTGSPGTLLATTSVSSTKIISSNSYVSFYFSSAPSVSSGTSYWIVLYVQPIGSNNYTWSSTTASSTAKISVDSGVTWSATGYSMNFKQYVSTTGGVKGLFRAYKNNGTKVTYMAHGTSLYTVDEVTGALTVIKSGLNAAATNYRFAFANDVLYYVNGYDGYRSYDGITEKQILSTNYTLICWHKGLIFLGGGPDPNAIVFSNFGIYDTFTSTDFVYAGAPKTGDPPVAFNSLNGYLLVRCKHNSFILSGDDNATFSIEQSPDQKGTYTQENVCQDNNYVYFLSDDGVRRSNGSESQLMSENIYEDIKNIVNKNNVCMVVNQGRLYLWYKDPSAGQNNIGYVWNLNFSGGGNFVIESKDTGAYVNRAFAAYQDADNLLVASSLVGQVFWQELDSNEYNNLGEPLNFELQTPYFTAYMPAQYKQIRYWKARFNTASNNYSLDCQYAYDARDNWQTQSTIALQGIGPVWGSGILWGAFIWGSTREVEMSSYIPGEYKYFAVRYSHSATRQPCVFLGNTFVLQIRRLR